MLRRLSAPSPRAQSFVQRANGGVGGFGNGEGRTISVPGPATITINVG